MDYAIFFSIPYPVIFVITILGEAAGTLNPYAASKILKYGALVALSCGAIGSLIQHKQDPTTNKMVLSFVFGCLIGPVHTLYKFIRISIK